MSIRKAVAAGWRSRLAAIAAATASSLVAAAPAGSEPEPERSDAEAEIRRVMAAYVAAWNAHDMDAWGRLFTENVDYVNRNGGWWRSNADNVAGHRVIHDSLRRRGTRMDLSAEVQQVMLLAPELALVHVTTAWPGLSTSGDGVSSDGMTTAIMIRRDDRWLIRAFHNTLRSQSP